MSRRPRWRTRSGACGGRCARAAAVPFIGIAAHTHTKRDQLIALFQEEKAVAILENINEIEAAL